MIITAKKGKGNKMHIYADDEYFITVSADFWFSGSIRQGDEISGERLESFKDKAQDSRAYHKLLDIISRRDYCRKELEDKLARAFGRNPASRAVQKAVDAGLVNDESYAAKYAEEMCRRKGFSLSKIKTDLIYKGIAREIVDEIIQHIDFDPRVRIIELLQTKYAHRFDDEKNRARTINALIRLGYSYSDIRAAMRELNVETPDE